MGNGSRCPHCGGPNQTENWTPITSKNETTTSWYEDEVIEYDTLIETNVPVYDSIVKPRFYYTVDRWEHDAWVRDTSHLTTTQRVVGQRHSYVIITLDYEGDAHKNRVDGPTYQKWNVGDYIPTKKRFYGHIIDTPDDMFQRSPVPASGDWEKKKQ